jgi:hypothetical protein
MQTRSNPVKNIGKCDVRGCPNTVTHEISWPAAVIKKVCSTHKDELEDRTFNDVREKFGGVAPPR